MLGKPKKGKEWLERAEEINETKETERYMKRLEKQILIYDVVTRQLGLDEGLSP
jgi:hypothetical protein